MWSGLRGFFQRSSERARAINRCPLFLSLSLSLPTNSPVSCSAAHLAGAARQRSFRSVHAARSSARRAAGTGNGGGAEGDGIDRAPTIFFFRRSKCFVFFSSFFARFFLFGNERASAVRESAVKGSHRRRERGREANENKLFLGPPLFCSRERKTEKKFERVQVFQRCFSLVSLFFLSLSCKLFEHLKLLSDASPSLALLRVLYFANFTSLRHLKDLTSVT